MLEPPSDPQLMEDFHLGNTFLRELSNAYKILPKKDVFCGNTTRPTIPLAQNFFETKDKIDTKYPIRCYEWLSSALNRSMFTINIHRNC
jgi:hypothetical protein